MDVSINLQLTENGRILLSFPEKFHKISAENHCDCRQIRSEQISANVTVKHCLVTYS